MTQKTERKTYTEDQDRILALLALSSQETKEKGACPTVEELETFAGGGAVPERRRGILAHLNTCPACYNEWLAMPPPLRESLFHRMTSGAAMFMENSFRFMREFVPSKEFLCMATVVMVCMATVVMVIIPGIDPSMDRQISQSYQSVLTQKMTLPKDKLPWEKRRRPLGFTGSDRHTPEYRAFGAGLWIGRETLTSQTSETSMPDFLFPNWDDPRNSVKADKWEDTHYARYFWLGKRSMLVQTLCQSDSELPRGFREEQIAVSERLRQDFNDVESVHSTLEHIESIMKTSHGDDLSEKQRFDIASKLYFLIQDLSPQRIPGIQR